MLSLPAIGKRKEEAVGTSAKIHPEDQTKGVLAVSEILKPCFQCGTTDLDRQQAGHCFLNRCNRCGREEEGCSEDTVKITEGAGVLRLEPTREARCPVHIIALRRGQEVRTLIHRYSGDERIARIVQTVCVGGRWIERVVFDRVPPSPPPTPQQGRPIVLHSIRAVARRHNLVREMVTLPCTA